MSEYRNRNYSKYDAMTTKELEDILRLDTSAPEGEDPDTELLLYVMGVLANRRKNTNSTGKTTLEAWQSFQQNYLDEEDSENIQKNIDSWTATPWLRRLIATAAVIALVAFLPPSAKAFDWEDIWSIFARWAKETFSFVIEENATVSEPSPEYNREYTSLQDILRANNRDANIIPTWIPDGFVLDRLEKDITPIQEIYRSLYLNGDKKLRIRVQNYISSEFQKIETDNDFSEIYTVSGTDYYIFKNDQQLQVAWIKDTYEGNISGNLSIEEAKKMIDSIRKG